MNPDTEDDGIKDGDEQNGVFGFYTSKVDADSDDDGLSDYEEIFTYHADPTTGHGWDRGNGGVGRVIEERNGNVSAPYRRRMGRHAEEEGLA